MIIIIFIFIFISIIMKNIMKKIKKLKTDNIYTNYLIYYNDISHIISRCNNN